MCTLIDSHLDLEQSTRSLPLIFYCPLRPWFQFILWMIQPGPIGRSSQIPLLPRKDLHPSKYQAQRIFSFARTTITKYTGWKNRNVQVSAVLNSPCFVGESLLPVSSFDLSLVPLCVHSHSSYKDTSYHGLGSALTTPNAVTFWGTGS